jgi:ketosteroid isomerase-like protein
MSNADVARRMFEVFLAQDADAASALIADDFVFVSPQDDHLDKATYLERCFPTADHFASFELLEVVDGVPVLVRYEYTVADGTRYRNMEAITVRDDSVTAVEVYFGGAV